jgi:pilus assembly protein CpaB
VIDEVLRGPAAAPEFAAQLLVEARRLAGSVALSTADETALEKLRALVEPQRERLMLRLLEGISGPEIAEATGAAPDEVRVGLELAFSEAFGGVVTGDAYLWSLTGAPHGVVARLENELSSLRFDASAPVAPLVAPSTDDVTKSGPALKAAPKVEDRTTPVGKPLDEPTNVGESPLLAGAEDRKGLDAHLASPLPSRGEGHGERSERPENLVAEDRTALRPLTPALSPPGGERELTLPASDLPIAAQVSPISVSPALAVLPRSANEPPTRSERPSADESAIQPLTVDQRPPDSEATTPRAAPLKPRDDDATAPRGAPLTMLAREWQPAAAPRPSAPKRDWHTSVAPRAEAPPPRAPFSLTRGTTPFITATVLLLFCVTATVVVVRAAERDVKKDWRLVPIVVANASIAEGTEISPEMLSKRDVPEEFATSSVVKPEAFRYITGQRILVPVQAGDPLLWSEFESHRTIERLSHRVLKRGRAYTIEGDDIVAVGGWIRPGDHIDLVVVVSEHAATTLQNLIVLATGEMSQRTNREALAPDEREYGNVTVFGLPEEVQVLAPTRDRAQEYWMVLRNETDFDTFDTKRAGYETLLTGARSRDYARAREPQLRVERPRLAPKATPVWGMDRRKVR